MLFQDHGSVGRIPYLVPVTWEDEWPVFGVNGQVPDELDIPVENDEIPAIVGSDEFEWDFDLSLVWQWNHNPDNDYWSVTERPGFFRLTNGRIDETFIDTQNTLTQRTFGPECSGIIAMDISHMQDGDVAGLGALQKNYGFVGVRISGSSKFVIMVKDISDNVTEVESIPVIQDNIYLQIAFDFKNKTDKAYFYYSLDGTEWQRIGNTLQMSYLLDHFMGYRFALFNYATKITGGYVDFDYFRIDNALPGSSALEEINQNIPNGFNLYNNFPNPFNPTTEICYDISKSVNININVYDITGRHVQTLVDGKKAYGHYAVMFDASHLASGLYLCSMKVGNIIKTHYMTLLK